MDLYEINSTNTTDPRDELARQVIVAVTKAMGPLLRDGDFCDSTDIYFHIWVNGVSVEIFGGPYSFDQRRAMGRALIAWIEDDTPAVDDIHVDAHELAWNLGVADFTSERGEVGTVDYKEADWYDVRVFINSAEDEDFTEKLRRIAGLVPGEQGPGEVRGPCAR